MDSAANGLLATKRSDENPPPSSPGLCLQQLDTICREFRIDSLLPRVNACGEVLKDGEEIPEVEWALAMLSDLERTVGSQKG